MVSQETINGKDVTVQYDDYGKWVCVQNYEHFGGENPAVSPGSTFPQLPNGLSDEATVNNLGTSGETRHVDNITQYGTWNVGAVRLEAVTDNHTRKIHYFTTDDTVISSVVDDSTAAGHADLRSETTYYSDHTSNLPDTTETKQTNATTNRIFGYEFPMYEGATNHWACAGNSNRWEVDDYPADESQTTVHRVWVLIPDDEASLETGTVSLSSTIDGGITGSVTFNNTYDNPVVDTYIATRGGGQSLQCRAKNVDHRTCDIHMEEADNGGHNTETVVYIVCEAGVHKTDGYVVEAGVHTTSTVRNSGDGSTYGDSVSFSHSWSSTPVVLHNLQTYNNGAFMATQANSVGTGSFNLSQEALETGTSSATEDIGYIAISTESSGGTLGGATFETNHEDDGANDGVDNNPHSIGFSASFGSTPDIIVSQNSMNGNDGTYARSSGTQWDTAGHETYAEEDQVGDSERGHTNETFGYLAIDPNADIVFTVKKTASGSRASVSGSPNLSNSSSDTSVGGKATGLSSGALFTSALAGIDASGGSQTVKSGPLNAKTGPALTLKVDGESDDATLGLTSDSTSSGGRVGPMSTEVGTKSSGGTTASAALNDLLGSGATDTISGALRELVEASTFSNPYSNAGAVNFENAEDNDISDWTVNEGTLTTDSSTSIGDYSMYHYGMSGVDSNETNDPRGAVKDLNSSRQIDNFSFMYWETSGNTSAAITLYNSNGNQELSFGTDNPAWHVQDAGGDTKIGNGGYEDWTRFTIEFDWANSNYTITAENLEEDYSASNTGSLKQGVDIAEVASGQVGLGGWTGGGKWYLDQMQINSDNTASTTSSNTTVVGGSGATDTISAALHELVEGSTFSNSYTDTQTGADDTAMSANENVGIGQTSTTMSAVRGLLDAADLISAPKADSVTTVKRVLTSATDIGSTPSTSSTPSAARGVGDAGPKGGSATTQTSATGIRTVVDGIYSAGSFSTSVTAGANINSESLRGRTSQPNTASTTGGETQLGSFGEQNAGLTEAASIVNDAHEIIEAAGLGAGATTDVVVNSLRESGSFSGVQAVGDSVVVPVGKKTVPSITGLTSGTVVEQTVYVSPQNASTSPQTGSFTTDTTLTALTENASCAPLTPTLSLVVNVQKGDIGLETALSDSLSASVGAETYINVAKTVGTADSIMGDGVSESIAESITSDAQFTTMGGGVESSSVAEGVATLTLLEGISEEHTATGVIGAITNTITNTESGDGTTSSTSNGSIPTAVADVFEGGVGTSTTAEALREAAEAAMRTGAVDTSVEAAAIASRAAADGGIGTPDTATGAGGIAEVFAANDETSQPTTDTTLTAIATLASSQDMSGDGDTVSNSSANTTEYAGDPLTTSAQALANVAAVVSLISMVDGEGVPDTSSVAEGGVNESNLTDLVTENLAESVGEGGVTGAVADGGEGGGTTSAISKAIKAMANGSGSGGDIYAEADVVGNTYESASQTNGATESFTATEALAMVTVGTLSPIEALLRFLHASLSGKTRADVITEQHVRLLSGKTRADVMTEQHVRLVGTQNEVEIIQQ